MITIHTPFFPTEDEKKIISALKNIFPGVSFKKSKDRIIGSSSSLKCLDVIAEKIEASRIKNTVFYLIMKNKQDETSRIELNKQALMLGKIHFVEEEYSLGNVILEFKNNKKIEDYLLRTV